MDNISVISISSSSSGAPSIVEEPRRTANSETQTVPVCWKGKPPIFNEPTPHPSKKVEDWFTSNRNEKPAEINGNSNENMVCIRYDFNKTRKNGNYGQNNNLLLEHNYNSPPRANRKIAKEKPREIETPFSSFEEFEKIVEDVVNYPTLKSIEELNMKIENLEKFFMSKRSVNKYLPLPPKPIYESQTDFEESILETVKEVRKSKKYMDNSVKRVEQKKFRLNLRRKFKRKFNFKRLRNKAKTFAKKKVEVPKSVMLSPRCEVLSVHTNSDDENVDVRNFVDDMLELNHLSEEHRQNIIESRILTSTSITNLINQKLSQEENVQKACKIFSEISEGKENAVRVVNSEHDYARNSDEITSTDEECSNEIVPVPKPNLEVIPVVQSHKKSLRGSLNVATRRKVYSTPCTSSTNHSISISKSDGTVIRAIYQNYNLIVAQEKLISFWTQSALGNVLGAQNMWIPKGQAERLSNSTYTQKHSNEMLIATDTSVAYVELWTKEHKSVMRETPVADVFAMVYFWRLRQNGLDKKALQLENIKGCSDDVQYVALKCCPRIIVSWHCVQGDEKKTRIRCYTLAADFQTVAGINEIQEVQHYVSSLHNIEDCENLIMGCGDNKITLWNVDFGYLVATIELLDIRRALSTLWVKCDRGFLFIVQECLDQELRLIAVNGMNLSWKQLQNYKPPATFSNVKGVCVENGVLVSYYPQGILCWNAQTSELVVEELLNEAEYVPSGKHVIILTNEQIIVRHALNHFITAD